MLKISIRNMVLIVLVLTVLLCQCNLGTKKVKKPNILMIMVDDMGWSDIGAYGGEINTPNLDRLAMEGMRFTQFHNTAICFASRACLLTGQYAQKVGMGKTDKSFLKNAVSLGEVLKNCKLSIAFD